MADLRSNWMYYLPELIFAALLSILLSNIAGHEHWSSTLHIAVLVVPTGLLLAIRVMIDKFRWQRTTEKTAPKRGTDS